MNKIPPPISVCVVIPMYNAEKTIVKTLDSISKQTRLPERIIIVDDGSRDNSAAVVAQYDAACEITLIRQKNQGPAAARNRGIAESTEDLICFLDADDVWVNQKLQKQVVLYQNLVAADHKVGLVDCFEVMHLSDGTEITFDRIKRGNHFEDFIKKNIINGTSCVLVNRDILNRVGGFDTDIRFAEDRWLWTKIAESYELHTVPEILSHRFIADTNITANPSKNYAHKMMFINKYLDKYSGYLSRKQLNMFVFSNIFEFMWSFFQLGEFEKVIQSFKDMMGRSWNALFYQKGAATALFIYAMLMRYFKIRKPKCITR